MQASPSSTAGCPKIRKYRFRSGSGKPRSNGLETWRWSSAWSACLGTICDSAPRSIKTRTRLRKRETSDEAGPAAAVTWSYPPLYPSRARDPLGRRDLIHLLAAHWPGVLVPVALLDCCSTRRRTDLTDVASVGGSDLHRGGPLPGGAVGQADEDDCNRHGVVA